MARAAQPPSTSSSLLVQLREAADGAAWRTFVDLYTPLVYGYARRRGLQDADAQDVVQFVFGQVCQTIRSFDYDRDRGRFRNWLGVLTSRAIGRQLRKAARPGQGPGLGADDATLEALAGDVEPEWIDEFNLQVCRIAMERIRPDFDPLVWRAFELTWVKGQEPKQVSRTVQKPAAWVYKAKFKVLERLRDEVQFLCEDAVYFSDE